ncbi:hypothetical protein QBC43DRAFT_311707 [Cladorrhinum sp. PSN259]|nr:hypothetical protein QBC43DRAFT_311707 [Cladorrhinum sp. PSN259]
MILHQHPQGSHTASPSPPSHPQRTQNTKPTTTKQRLERRGHTKSRRGCYNCKRRRIKCQETKPCCGNCVKTGLECTYPPPPSSSYSSSSLSSAYSRSTNNPAAQAPPAASLLNEPSGSGGEKQFTLLDLRLFHHFLSTCYPHHPLGSEPLWTHEIPCLSQAHPFLMHAILGYAASSLADSVSVDSSSQRSEKERVGELYTAAMSHRVKAIRDIKRCLSDSSCSDSKSSSSASSPSSEGGGVGGGCQEDKGRCKKEDKNEGVCKRGKGLLAEEGNALMATCFALTFQSVLLDDGMVEYMTFIRGIVIVAIQMYVGGLDNSKMMFGELLVERESQKKLEPYMLEVGLVRREWVDDAVVGLNGLEVLLGEEEVDEEGNVTKSVEREYWELLKQMTDCLHVSSWKAYLAMTEHYGWWMRLSHERFQRLIAERGNQVAVLLATHWIALKQIMAVITETEGKAAVVCPPGRRPQREKEYAGKAGNDISLGIIRWLKYLNGLVDEEHLVYNRWPMWVEAQLDVDRRFFGKTH